MEFKFSDEYNLFLEAIMILLESNFRSNQIRILFYKDDGNQGLWDKYVNGVKAGCLLGVKPQSLRMEEDYADLLQHFREPKIYIIFPLEKTW